MTQPDPPEVPSDYLRRLAEWVTAFQERPELRQLDKAIDKLLGRTTFLNFADFVIQDESGAVMQDEGGAVIIAQVKQYSQPTLADVRAADRFVRSYLPRAADHPDEVKAAAAEVASDPEQRKKVARVAGIMRRPEVQALSQWALVIIAILLLMYVVGLLPVEQLSAAQESLDDRMLGVLGIALALAAFVKPPSGE